VDFCEEVFIEGLTEQGMERVMSIKVAINGYGTIGKRVADAVDAQDRRDLVSSF